MNPCALYNMESFEQEIVLSNLFKVKGAWNKGQLLRGGIVEKRLRTTGLVITDNLQYFSWHLCKYFSMNLEKFTVKLPTQKVCIL